MTSDAPDRLLDPYRVVRRVTAGVDGPWAGLLVRLPSDASRVLVDASAIDDDWAGWRAAEAGHVLACVDVVRRGDGQDVVLPVCPRRVTEALRLRRDARVVLTPGERVTIAVSVLRGLSELHALCPDHAAATGEWWLTDAGKPVLATGVSSAAVLDVSLQLIDELADPVFDVWRRIRETLEADALTERSLARLEDELFAIARPEPLGEAALARPHETWASDAPRPGVADPVTQGAVDARDRRNLFDSLARHVDADVADLVSRTTTRAWRRLRTRTPGRGGRPWAVAATAAGLVIVAGALWPGTEEPVAAEAPPPTAASHGPEQDRTHAAESSPSADAAVPTDDAEQAEDAADAANDLAGVTQRLLTERSACQGAETCLASVQEDALATFPAGAVDAAAEARRVLLLDDFGGVAVMRVDTDEHGSQLVVIQRTDDSWLLRDVYAAQQP